MPRPLFSLWLIKRSFFLSFCLSVCLLSPVKFLPEMPFLLCEPVNSFFGRKEEQKVKENQRQISKLLGLRQISHKKDHKKIKDGDRKNA